MAAASKCSRRKRERHPGSGCCGGCGAVVSGADCCGAFGCGCFGEVVKVDGVQVEGLEAEGLVGG